METKEYTPEEIAVLEAKAAKYDKARKMKRKLIIGGGVIVGFFIAGAISAMVEENSEETPSDEDSVEYEETKFFKTPFVEASVRTQKVDLNAEDI